MYILRTNCGDYTDRERAAGRPILRKISGEWLILTTPTAPPLPRGRRGADRRRSARQRHSAPPVDDQRLSRYSVIAGTSQRVQFGAIGSLTSVAPLKPKRNRRIIKPSLSGPSVPLPSMSSTRPRPAR